jgi:hypothetical protein
MSTLPNKLVIKPKGSIHNRIKVMISARIFAKSRGLDLFMIWDHPNEFDSFFMDYITVITTDFLKGKKYYYNPNKTTEFILDNVSQFSMGKFVVLETQDEFYCNEKCSNKTGILSLMEYRVLRMETYRDLIKNHLSGNVLGKINMVDMSANCVVFGEKSHQTSFGLSKYFNNKYFNDYEKYESDEEWTYLLTIALSRAECILYLKDNVNLDEYLVSVLEIVPISIYCSYEQECDLAIVSTNWVGMYPTVLNPDVNQMCKYINRRTPTV